MFTLFTYLLASLFSIYYFNPKNKLNFWKSVLLFPLLVSLWYVMSALNESYGIYGYSMYEFGSIMSKCILPFIISCCTTFFFLKKKMLNNGKIKFPITFFIITLLTFGIGLFQNSLENDLRKKSLIKAPLSKEQETALTWIKYNVVKTQEKLPEHIANNFYLNKIEYNENENSIYYTYKDIDADLKKLEMTEKDTQESKISWKKMFIRTLKKDSNKDAYIEAKTILQYEIIDKNEKSIVKFSINPDEYK